ncbi:similar to Saccharomyces cerevisiae YMR133W REC114 Protein involved in early stages of meiotic recombination [Maudiozyma saulgeensis]|uniref:Similar to Saccharomyces cerevisiae YMR133W REC114 Protein involved in early stages of meiotic recombination n=1 Tax=Maudiozyma saulgeensis TaxID=1789683 RepID=A0A1X7R106_9SACH|nr:similar to Saccharomyces cerevisiae YMR133W REC114 Protein involved in early stages of meiotic recombination [Kazachstania saulgeensis]
MAFNFSIPIKTYSKYDGTIIAPYGFNSLSPQFDNKKWQHFNHNYQITFLIEIVQEKLISIRTVMGSTTLLDDILTTVDGLNEGIRCSSRCPSLSFKYLKQENRVQVLKRFQLEFNNSTEFSSVKKTLQAIRLNIKEFPPVHTQQTMKKNCSSNNNIINYSQYQIENSLTGQISKPFNSICDNENITNEFNKYHEPPLINSQVESSTCLKNNTGGIKDKGFKNTPISIHNKLPSIDFLIQHTIGTEEEKNTDHQRQTNIENIIDPRAKLNSGVLPQKISCYPPRGTGIDYETTLNSQLSDNSLVHDNNIYGIQECKPAINHNMPFINKKLNDVRMVPIKGIQNTSPKNVDSPNTLSAKFPTLNSLPVLEVNKVGSSHERSDDAKTKSLQENKVPECDSVIETLKPEIKNAKHSLKKPGKIRIKITKKIIKEKLNNKKFMKWVCIKI